MDAQQDDRYELLGGLLLALDRLGLVLTRAIDAIGGGDLSANHDLAVLAALATRPRRPRTLASMVGMTTAGVSNLLDRLEGLGMVERTASLPTDRRAVMVSLTAEGHRAVAAVTHESAIAYKGAGDARDEILELIERLGTPAPRAAGRAVDPTELVAGMAAMGASLVAALTCDDYPADPSPSRTAVLLALASRGPVRPRDVVSYTSLSRAGVSLLLDRIEARAWIVRIRGEPPDRRATSVRLSATGEDALRRRLDGLAGQLEQIRDALR